MPKNNDPKALVINDETYAHYIIEKGVLYLKVRKNIIRNDRLKSEGYLSDLISLIEGRKVNYVSYLNIK